MDKIYNLLQEIQEELYKPLVDEPEEFISITSHPGMEDEMSELYRSVNDMLPDTQKKVIQFIGSREGEGTSTIAREFAVVSAKRFGKSVLLLDADINKPSQHSFFNIRPRYSCEDVIRFGSPIDNALYQVENSSLFVGIVYTRSSTAHQGIDFLFDNSFLKKMLQFDLIVVDSPPVTKSRDGLAISRMIDGVILIFEAEKTRWPIAKSIKEKIEKNGGKILGIAFNKRRHYIPEFIYKRL
jgi:Mrp family chromosome partitioning ATPase